MAVYQKRAMSRNYSQADSFNWLNELEPIPDQPILQIVATSSDHERPQALENYLRDEFADVKRQTTTDWGCRDA
jgi:hypothetical protein